jgi:hypothetical protein
MFCVQKISSAPAPRTADSSGKLRSRADLLASGTPREKTPPRPSPSPEESMAANHTNIARMILRDRELNVAGLGLHTPFVLPSPSLSKHWTFSIKVEGSEEEEEGKGIAEAAGVGAAAVAPVGAALAVHAAAAPSEAGATASAGLGVVAVGVAGGVASPSTLPPASIEIQRTRAAELRLVRGGGGGLCLSKILSFQHFRSSKLFSEMI